MRHVFKATKIGWDEEQEGVWFDSDFYSKEEAEAEFKPYQGTTQRGYPYTGYEYDGEQYHDVTYMGEFDDDDLPQTTRKLVRSERGSFTPTVAVSACQIVSKVCQRTMRSFYGRKTID